VSALVPAAPRRRRRSPCSHLGHHVLISAIEFDSLLWTTRHMGEGSRSRLRPSFDRPSSDFGLVPNEPAPGGEQRPPTVRRLRLSPPRAIFAKVAHHGLERDGGAFIHSTMKAARPKQEEAASRHSALTRHRYSQNHPSQGHLPPLCRDFSASTLSRASFRRQHAVSAGRAASKLDQSPLPKRGRPNVESGPYASLVE
jgi:hypothetical protein